MGLLGHCLLIVRVLVLVLERIGNECIKVGLDPYLMYLENLGAMDIDGIEIPISMLLRVIIFQGNICYS